MYGGILAAVDCPLYIAVQTKDKKIEELKKLILERYGSESEHIDSIFVVETDAGELVWDGMVEVFELARHPRTKWCYAWNYKEEGDEKFATVLQIPPVISATTAVR